MTLCFLDCRLDVDARTLSRAGTPVHLTPKAFELLLVLLNERPRAVPKTELLQRVWPDTFVTDASLARTVHEIRDAIGGTPSAVRTVHGHGYAFAADAAMIDGPGHVAPTPHAWLAIDGHTVALNGASVTIGRDPAATVPLHSPLASWHHARLTLSSRGVTIEDLGSKNGTYVRGARVVGPTPLGDGDEITIAGMRLVLVTGAVRARTVTDVSD